VLFLRICGADKEAVKAAKEKAKEQQLKVTTNDCVARLNLSSLLELLLGITRANPGNRDLLRLNELFHLVVKNCNRVDEEIAAIKAENKQLKDRQTMLKSSLHLADAELVNTEKTLNIKHMQEIRDLKEQLVYQKKMYEKLIISMREGD
jgi:hypothetical protein